ncbi:MAG TPA: S-methyl-5-thioribose-1-phosphate isomerase [Herpetosiphonaceae bacterium]|nr:S-methyl-5-thioribose-1-phosphate isomerase [Herpetosiphonaceae bacterium]
MELQTVWWEPGAVCLIDQTRLPHQQEIVRCATVSEVVDAIRGMIVRGAPAIGVTAAYGMVLAAMHSAASDVPGLLADLRRDKAALDLSRPTAVNLRWATERMIRCAEHATGDVDTIRAHLLQEAQAVRAEDLAMCHAIGKHGAELLQDGARVLTHCNAGGLATAGYGTALAPLRTAHAVGKRLHVLVDETRPFLQGARLTAWELQQAGIPQTLITDNMAGYFMSRGEVDCVIVGADRVVANGDIANKIGTYSLAVLAHAHGIPFYVAVPSSTVDLSIGDGGGIPIEQRDPDEVTHLAGRPLAPVGVHAAHPAFDVTPHRLIDAIITEQGVIRPPYTLSLRRLFETDE